MEAEEPQDHPSPGWDRSTRPRVIVTVSRTRFAMAMGAIAVTTVALSGACSFDDVEIRPDITSTANPSASRASSSPTTVSPTPTVTTSRRTTSPTRSGRQTPTEPRESSATAGASAASAPPPSVPKASGPPTPSIPEGPATAPPTSTPADGPAPAPRGRITIHRQPTTAVPVGYSHGAATDLDGPALRRGEDRP